METLLTVGVILLLILVVLFIAVLLLALKFFRDVRQLLAELHHEADKVKVDIANLRSRITKKSTLFTLALGLLGKRKAVARIAEAFVKSR